MATYRTTRVLRDILDNEFLYKENQLFPREGVEVPETRLKELVKEGYLVKVEEATKQVKKGE